LNIVGIVCGKKIVRWNASEEEINVRLTKVYSYIVILRGVFVSSGRFLTSNGKQVNE